MVGDELRLHPVAVQQHARPARVLAGHHVRLAQRGQHAQRDVLEVPDRRRADDEPPAHGAQSDDRTPSARRPSSPPRRRSGRARSAPPRAPAAARARATTARAGSSSRSPPRTAPPPITITSGLNVFTSPTSPKPSRSPTSSSTSRASGSPSCASSVTIPPLISLLGGEPPPERRVRLRLAPPAAPRGRSRSPTRAPRSSPDPGAVAGAVGPVQLEHRRGRARRPPRTRRGTPRRSASSPPPIPVPSETITAWRAPAAAPLRASASIDALPSLSTTTGSPSRSLIRSRNGTPSSGRWFDQRETPVSDSTSAGTPNADRLHVRRGRPDLLDGVREDVERLLPVGSPPGPANPVVDHHLLVDDARRGAWCPRRRYRSRASVAWAVDIQRGVNDPTPGPPEYKVYRSRRKPLARRRRPRCAPQEALAPPRRRRAARRRASSAPITPAASLKWVAIAIGGWLAALARPVPDQRPDPGRASRPRPSARSRAGAASSAGSNILVLGSDVRNGRLDRRVAVRAPAAPTRSCSSTPPSGASASCRSRATSRWTSPATAINKINAAYALGGPGAHDRDASSRSSATASR